VSLPTRVDEHAADATFNNGVLEVSFKRADASADINVD
jgi:HSP20 family protein